MTWLPPTPTRGGCAVVLCALLASCAATPSAPADPVVAARLDEFARHKCIDETARALTALRIDPGRIESLVYDTDNVEVSGSDRIVGYRAWIGLADTRGRLVVAHDRDCRVRGTYTTTIGY